MTWHLPQPNPPPPCCFCPQPRKFPPPRLRVVLLRWIFILLILQLRILWLCKLCWWILSRLVVSSHSFNLHLLIIIHQVDIHYVFLQQLKCSTIFLIVSYRFTKFTIHTSWCTYNLLQIQTSFWAMESSLTYSTPRNSLGVYRVWHSYCDIVHEYRIIIFMVSFCSTSCTP